MPKWFCTVRGNDDLSPAGVINGTLIQSDIIHEAWKVILFQIKDNINYRLYNDFLFVHPENSCKRDFFVLWFFWLQNPFVVASCAHHMLRVVRHCVWPVNLSSHLRVEWVVRELLRSIKCSPVGGAFNADRLNRCRCAHLAAAKKRLVAPTTM